MSANRLLIAGAGGHGKVVAETAEASGNWEKIAFIDDRFPSLSQVASWPVIGTSACVQELLGEYSALVVAIGDNKKRIQQLRDTEKIGFTSPSIIHPTAVISPSAKIGAGTVVFANVCVNAGAIIGAGVILNTAVSVDHDCVLDEAVHLSPGVHLGGSVFVGRCTWIGIGAVVIHGIKIGEDTIVGAGAAVIQDVPNAVKVVGVPAKLMLC